ncbi:MAG: alpha-ketoglutarate-dependent dioxygenase AlkB [Flavobacteriia bacterium]|nr:alpha-ketoglutarate-dependent dioxygenase AlkB [Flavobacteriia bacterium]
MPRVLHNRIQIYEEVLPNPDLIFTELLENVNWKHESITLFGKEVLQPRLTAWYGDKGVDYTYSGLKNEALPWTATLLEVKQSVERLAQYSFNSVLLNLYRDGSDGMGYHSDDERELGEEPIIASLSLGEVRRFNIKNKETGELISFDLPHNSLLIMKGDFQSRWKHAVPKTKRVVGPRVNLTFRRIL